MCARKPVPRILAVLALASIAIPVSAHPHMFLDSIMTLEMDTAGLAGFWLEWTFDPFFSAMVKLNHDSDGNNSFSAGETEQVRQNAFSNLRSYGYFLWLTWRGKETRPDTVRDFAASMVGDRLVYRFFVPYAVPVKAGSAESFSVAIYDDTFFCDVRYTEDRPVRLPAASGSNIAVEFRVVKDSGRSVRYSTTDGNVATNMGTRDPARYTGLFQPPVIQVEMRRPAP